jgi:hypothetical protein
MNLNRIMHCNPPRIESLLKVTTKVFMLKRYLPTTKKLTPNFLLKIQQVSLR